MHQPVDKDNVFVYVLLQDGDVINVYREYFEAVTRAIEEVTGDANNTLIDSFEHIIYVEGDKGTTSIQVEQLF